MISVLSFLLLSSQLNSFEWTNRIGNQTCYPSYYSEPGSLQELCYEITRHASEGTKIRAVGAGYSISDICCTEGCLISTNKLNRILEVDKKNKTVRVEAGITLDELNRQLALYNFALPNQAAIDIISLGGALSTGVHGTGHTGSFSSFVNEYELVTADGSLRLISLQSDPEAFKAVSVSLGTLGIIYAVTLQCEELFYLTRTDIINTAKSIIEDFHEIYASNDFVQFMLNPETDTITAQCWNRAPASSTSKVSYEALAWYQMDENDNELFSEIAIPLPCFPGVMRVVQRFLNEHRETGVKFYDLNIRFVQQDHAYLSPAGDGAVAYFAFCFAEQDKYFYLFKEFENLLAEFGGRPHWAKYNQVNATRINSLYGINLSTLIKIKKKFDPNEIFSNAYIERILKTTMGN